MNYQLPLSLLPFLSACLYGDAKSFYGHLDEEERSLLEKQAREHGMTAWLYRYLNDVLPNEKRTKYQRRYQEQEVRTLKGKLELDRLCGVLRDNGLRFALIKGADLAYRLYPDAALRLFGDWDILFYPDDCERALSVLAADGWTVESVFVNSDGIAKKTSNHHYASHFRDGCRLEPHDTLPNFTGVDPHEIWESTMESPAGGGQRVLSPEMNLLMLTRHAAGAMYYHARIPKLLIDAAVILQKEPVDFVRLRAMADRRGMPYPGDLLAAFPEFFPADVVKSFHADPAECTQFRALFEKRGKLGEQISTALTLNRFHVHGRLLAGLLNQIRSCGPGKIRSIYRLPERGVWGRVMWSYACYFGSRTWQSVATWLRSDRELEEYVRIVEGRESIPRDGRRNP